MASELLHELLLEVMPNPQRVGDTIVWDGDPDLAPCCHLTSPLDANVVKQAWDARPDLHEAVMDEMSGNGMRSAFARAVSNPAALARALVLAARAASASEEVQRG